MLPVIKKILVLILLPCLIFSCTLDQKRKKQKRDSTSNSTGSELTLDQQSSFDALNRLQINTDDRNRLYSTFANIVQPCYPADTSLVITQSELLIALKQFVKENCTNLNIEERDKLIKSAVLAQKEYTVLHCTENLSAINYEKGLPMIGIWVMPNVLDRRDVILVW